MRRIIEELIAKRKQQQTSLEKSLNHLGELLSGRGWRRKSRNKEIREEFSRLNRNISDLITVQDREWDAYSNNHTTGVFKSLHWKIDKLEAEYANVRALITNFMDLEKSLQNLIGNLENTCPENALSDLKTAREKLSVFRYADFEERFRGSSTEISGQLGVYLPHFTGCDSVLDIGCGRGEFVELLLNQGIAASGIDLSPTMLEAAAVKNLPCRKADALDYLQGLPANSLGGIFSAQVIEHLPPDYLRDLVMECHRVLKPGSPIILETVNPLSLFALSNIYFLDATHEKPLHPEYMRYLLESHNFSAVEIIYSPELQTEKLCEVAADQPLAREFNTNVDKLNKILFAAPAYAAKGVRA